MKKNVFLLLLFCLFVITGCSAKEGRPLADFQYTDQDGQALGLKDLKGKVWVANMVFTNCTTVCPTLTANMSDLQRQVEDAGLDDVHFVSFSVDPEVDSPEALKKYAESFAANFSTWHFLTGYTQKEIEDYALKNFKEWVVKPEDDDQVIHGTKFFLINKKGEVISDYPGNEDVPYKQILKDIKSARKH
ncbi:SCO family protein [Lederbergia sp. NSJ-179]|uniref:SCO family protein n=1 Tax=Lederbergia sp. NSJ-179 TaxID=2931402 RepID=UPI001FD07A04|nr:SCO family protein [Lederbergia sp. NSJ-179]MCJ7840407.1 SCO family protein [Lederbergia sp. NSJ-179]